MTGHLRLGVNIDHVATVRQARREAFPDPVAWALRAEAAGAGGITCHLRVDRRHIQDDDVLRLREAIGISERALQRTLDSVKLGQSEKQIEQTLVQALFAEGADDLSFGPIVAAADGSARPHAHAREDYAVKAGDALLLDFGARKNGFAADITRTVFLDHVTDEGRDVYDTVLRANMAGLAVTRAGVTAHDIDDAVISVLEASPYGDRIRTKTGHGLGREAKEGRTGETQKGRKTSCLTMGERRLAEMARCQAPSHAWPHE